MAQTEAQIRAKAKYDAANTVQLHLKLNINTDKDILDWLADKPKQTVIKEALRKMIRKEG